MAQFTENPRGQAILDSLEGKDSVQILKGLFVEFSLHKEETKDSISKLTKDVNSMSLTFDRYKTEMNEYTKELDEEREETKVSLNYQDERLSKAEEKITAAENRIRILEGTVRKQENELYQAKEEIVNLKVRSMSKNVLLHKLPEGEKETKDELITKVTDFFVDEMKMQRERVEQISIEKLHRMGNADVPRKFPRSVVLKINSDDDRGYIFSHAKNLDKDKYSISGQYPPEMSERRNILKQTMNSEEMKDKPRRLIQDKLYVGGKLYTPGCISENNSPEGYNAASVDWSKLPKIYQTKSVTDNGNCFISYSASIASKQDARFIIDMVKGMQCEKPSTHLAYAYRIPYGLGTSMLEYMSDDGEFGLGWRLLEKMKASKSTGTILLASRWYASHIGPRRFKHYLDTCEEALIRKQLGPNYIDS